MEKQKEHIMDKIRRLFAKVDGFKSLTAWFVAVGVAVVCYLIVLIPFFVRGTYTVWTESAGDAATQGVTFLAHVRDRGYLKAIGEYDFYQGLGADYLTSYSFFSLFDPFNLLFFALPFGDLMNYSIAMACKQIATALTMFAYLHYKRVRNSRATILSVAYMLTGFTVFTGVRHYNLTAGPIYLPLAILGIEKVFEKKRPFLFIATVFLCLITNFYVFFSMSVFLVAYAIAYYFHNAAQTGQKAGVKDFFARLVPLGCFYLLGVALAGFMLFPNLYGYLNAARSASKGLQWFAPEDFFTQLLSLTLPVFAKNYSSMWINGAFAALTLFAIYKKGKETKLYAWFVIVLTAGYLLPLFGYAMNIFNYCNNRWSYGLSFFVFALIGLQSKNEEQEEAYGEDVSKKVNITFTIYLGLMAATALPALVSYLKLTAWLYLPLALLAGGIAYGCYRWIRRQKNKPVWKFLQKIYRPSVLFALSFAITMTYALGGYVWYSSEHNGAERMAYLYSEEETFIAEEAKEEYFRADTRVTSEWYYSFTNRSVNNLYYGTSNYNSISNKYVYEFLKENGVYNPTQNLGVSGLDGRYALQNLLSVQYSYDKFGGSYGFTKVDGFEYLYKNSNYAGVGFMLPKTYSKEYYLSQDVLARQYMLLDGIVLEDGVGNADGTWNLPLVKRELCGAKTLKQGERIRVELDYDESNYQPQEFYIAVRGVQEVDGLTFVDVQLDGAVKEYYYATKGNLMYSEQRDFYLNFGVLETPPTSAEIYIKEGRHFSFESMELIAVPKANEGTMSAFTGADRLQDIVLDGNSFAGKITASDDGYMMLSLPYSNGWTARVDGVETELVRADTAFMAVALSAGEHTVEFCYETPYLELGKKVSFVGIGLLVALGIADTAWRIVRKKKETSDP